MNKRNENGKPKIQMCTLPKRKRQRYFLICGTCDVVSIAENAPIERKAAGENSLHMKEEEKRFIAVREGQNAEKCTHRVEYSLGPKKDQIYKIKTSFRAYRKETLFVTGKKWTDLEVPRRHVGAVAMINIAVPMMLTNRATQDKHGQKRLFQNAFELNSSSKQLKIPNCTKLTHGTIAKKRQRTIRAIVLLNNDPASQENRLLARSSPRKVKRNFSLKMRLQPLHLSLKIARLAANKPCNAPEIQINGAVAKPSWVEEDPARATSGISSNRWKRLSALKFKVNRIQGKRVERRDTVVVSEEYEMMMANLKLYGVM
ncbi:hypothetical protein OS493_040306 [Desmophyllum pertusum]|uniref:Uncharacterized protein n=1 Tax=Desmophyllum pertusum TaxID=174260 RepID=A0A9W9Y6H4_9CNID|nr:hypothetical protein OS493_040306 [Desmophyllum pertusum]